MSCKQNLHQLQIVQSYEVLTPGGDLAKDVRFWSHRTSGNILQVNPQSVNFKRLSLEIVSGTTRDVKRSLTRDFGEDIYREIMRLVMWEEVYATDQTPRRSKTEILRYFSRPQYIFHGYVHDSKGHHSLFLKDKDQA